MLVTWFSTLLDGMSVYGGRRKMAGKEKFIVLDELSRDDSR